MVVRGGDEKPRWRRFVARHRRTLLTGYLSLVALVFVALAVAPLRERVLLGVERAVDAWEARWTPRVEEGEQLVAAGRYEEAARYLSRLDQSFPARDVRHARDRQRERILRALGRAHAALDQQAEALDAFGRAVAFDPLNYRNRLTLARAATRFNEEEIALEQYREILSFRPSHLPSLRAVVAHRYDQADYAGVVGIFERYLNAFVAHHLVVSLGPASDTVTALVDGIVHRHVARFDEPPAGSAALHLGTGPYAAEARRAVLEERPTLGVAERVESAELTGRWKTGSPVLPTRAAVDSFPTGETTGSAGPDELIRVPLRDVPPQVARVTVDLRLLKPMEAETWKLVEASYRNLLDFEGLEAARRRSFLMEDPPPVRDPAANPRAAPPRGESGGPGGSDR